MGKMKIFALTTFVLCLICVLTLQVESFENAEGKAPKKGGKKPAKALTGFTSCKKVTYDTKKNTITALCKGKAKKSKAVKLTLSLAKCEKIKSSKVCKMAKKNVLSCKAKKAKKATTFDLNKLVGFKKKISLLIMNDLNKNFLNIF